MREPVDRSSDCRNSPYMKGELEPSRSMSDPLSRIATRVAYAATQLPRLAWYAGHGYVMRQLAAQARRPDRAPRRDGAGVLPAQPVNVPDQRRIYADLADLLAQDLANIEAGRYPLPADHD